MGRWVPRDRPPARRRHPPPPSRFPLPPPQWAVVGSGAVRGGQPAWRRAGRGRKAPRARRGFRSAAGARPRVALQGGREGGEEEEGEKGRGGHGGASILYPEAAAAARWKPRGPAGPSRPALRRRCGAEAAAAGLPARPPRGAPAAPSQRPSERGVAALCPPSPPGFMFYPPSRFFNHLSPPPPPIALFLLPITPPRAASGRIAAFGCGDPRTENTILGSCLFFPFSMHPGDPSGMRADLKVMVTRSSLIWGCVPLAFPLALYFYPVLCVWQ